MSRAPTMQPYHLPKSADTRARVLERLSRVLAALPLDRVWRVEIHEHRPRRSKSQNALLWALYTQIQQRCGEELKGYTTEELHEFFLGSKYGWDVREIFGHRETRPTRRSSGMDKQEFSDFIEHVVVFMAERGVVLDLPEDTRWSE